jgi:hypothetical protein
MARDLRCTSAPHAILRIAKWFVWRLKNARRCCLQRHVWTGLIAGGLLLSGWSDSLAQQPPPLLMRRQVRDEAIRAIPFDQMDERVRGELSQIVSAPSLYRRLPVQTVDCDPDMFLFLLRYPEVIVDIWRLMEVTKVQVTRTGPTTFSAVDGAGTVANVQLIHSSPNVHVYYGNGYYEGPLLRNRLTGSCVIVMQNQYGSSNDRIHVTCTLDVFARLDNAGVDLLAKTLNPLVGKTADYNFVETAKFVSQLSLASESNGPGVQRLAANLTGVDPQVREAFARHAEAVYQRGLLRQGSPLDPLSAAEPLGNVSSGANQGWTAANEPNTLLEPVTPREHRPSYRR